MTTDSSVLLFSLAQLRTIFNDPEAVKECFVATTNNGDAIADGYHSDGASWSNDELRATFDRAVSNKEIRVNYVIRYTPLSELYERTGY